MTPPDRYGQPAAAAVVAEDPETLENEFSSALRSLTRSSLVSLLLVSLGVLTLAGSVYYSATRLEPLEAEVAEKRAEAERLERTAESARATISDLSRTVAELQGQVESLRAESTDLISFLGEVSKREHLGIVHDSVDARSWQQVVSEISQVPPGQRKMAILHAILLAWKPLPFKLQGLDLREGVNSPAFIIHLLSTVGLKVPQRPDQRSSEALRESTDSVDEPSPGDLMFYRGTAPGSTGEYVMLYLGTSIKGSHGVCLGIMGRQFPLQIVDATYLETSDKTGPADVFTVYRRPRYR